MPHILLIEDNPGDIRLLEEMLREVDETGDEYSLVHVERISDAVALLSGPYQFDLILSDITLPDSHGQETFDSLQSAAAELPVVFMTGSNEKDFAISAIHQGAQDYLVKGHITSDSLSKAISYAIERKRAQVTMNQVLAEAQVARQRVRLLAQQKRQLLNLNKAKDDFISLASHQLRTPATAVKQYIGMIIEGFVGDIDATLLPLLQTAYDSNERQLTIIDELLKTAQIDSNRYELNLERQDVTGLLSEVIAAARPTMKLHRQNVVFDDTRQHTAKFDRSEFKLVLTNLLENACKYTPDGKAIYVTLRSGVKKLHITFRDEGVGIASDDQKRIFDKFTRVDNELSDTVSGSGLGLYWVRKIMRLHKGAIDVESSPGQGSSFTLSLPT